MITIKKYSKDYYGKWNEFIENSNNGTIFHRLDFLDYHKQKFNNFENHLMWFKGDQIIAVMPMAIFEAEGKRIAKSPFGGSYGGIITKDVLDYSNSKLIAKSLVQFFVENQINEAVITPPIKVLETNQCDTLLFSLLEQGFKFLNSDISSVVNLVSKDLERDLFSTRAKRMVKKAQSVNVYLKENQSPNDFWKLIELTFDKHGTTSTHSFEEWKYLCESFPQSFWNDIAYLNEKPIAGIGHIKVNKYTDSSFYLCSDPDYYDTQALTFLIYKTLFKSKDKGFKWFDFGTSSINMKARDNIFMFKENFGTIGVFRHTIKISII